MLPVFGWIRSPSRSESGVTLGVAGERVVMSLGWESWTVLLVYTILAEYMLFVWATFSVKNKAFLSLDRAIPFVRPTVRSLVGVPLVIGMYQISPSVLVPFGFHWPPKTNTPVPGSSREVRSLGTPKDVGMVMLAVGSLVG